MISIYYIWSYIDHHSHPHIVALYIVIPGILMNSGDQTWDPFSYGTVAQASSDVWPHSDPGGLAHSAPWKHGKSRDPMNTIGKP